MGQKINPTGFRLGVLNGWRSNWFTERDFAKYLDEDRVVRNHITGKLSHAGLSSIHLKKDQTKLTVDIFTARPGIVIGKSGSEVDALRRELNRLTGKQIQVNINEIKRPELDAKLVAQSIAEQLENRVSFRRAMKRALTSAMRSGAQGVKVQCGGRLGGTEMSRSEHYSRRPRAAAHAARGHRLRLPRGQDHLRPHRRQGAGSTRARSCPRASRTAAAAPTWSAAPAAAPPAP